MNRPMPTTIADFSEAGTALNTAVRKPVSTSTNMITPAQMISPMACAQVSPGVVAIVTARNALTPRPVATANGVLATTPIRIVMTPPIRAVMAATRSTPRVAPAESAPSPRIRGLSTTM